MDQDLSRDFSGSASAPCSIGWSQSLDLISAIWAEKEDPKSWFTCLAPLCSSIWTFFLFVAKMGFLMVISVYPDFLCGLSFPIDIIISREGTYCRPKARSQKLYTITYVAFCQLKQPQHRLMQKRNKLHFRWECVCYIWGKHNPRIFCPRGSHWLTSTAAALWTSTMHAQGHTTTTLGLPASDRGAETLRLAYPRDMGMLGQPTLNCELLKSLT